MSSYFCRNSHRNSRLNDIISPEEVKHLKRGHHKDHKPINEKESLSFKLVKSFCTFSN